MVAYASGWVVGGEGVRTSLADPAMCHSITIKMLFLYLSYIGVVLGLLLFVAVGIYVIRCPLHFRMGEDHSLIIISVSEMLFTLQ